MKKWLKWTLLFGGLALIVAAVWSLIQELEIKNKQNALYTLKVEDYEDEQSLSLEDHFEHVRIIGLEATPVESSLNKYRSEKWNDVLDGASVSFDMKNKLEYHDVKVHIRVSGKTRYKAENDFIWKAKKFQKEYESGWFSPHQTVSSPKTSTV